MTSDPVVRAEGLTKRYGTQVVLDAVDLRVGRGERVAVVGLNGAGKTTLFRCLLGLADFDGALEVGGFPAGPSGKAARERIGYVPQQPPRFDLSLREFVRLFSALRGAEEGEVAGRLGDLGLSLDVHGGKALADLSGGMLQKALLAVALGSRPPLLLLDEPTANLDPASRRDFLRSLGRVDEGTTLLFASHRLDDVESLADRILVLHRGRFVFDGSPVELREGEAGGSRLWLQVPRGERGSLARELERCPSVRRVREEAAGIDLVVGRGRRARVLSEIEARGYALLDFRTRPPALEEVMRRVTEACR